MTKTEKILSCYGQVNSRSAARMIGAKQMYVLQIWNKYGLRAIFKNKHRQ